MEHVCGKFIYYMRSFVKVFHWHYTTFGCLKEIIGNLIRGKVRINQLIGMLKKVKSDDHLNCGTFENLVIRDFCKGPNIRINQFVGKMPNTMINKFSMYLKGAKN